MVEKSPFMKRNSAREANDFLSSDKNKLLRSQVPLLILFL